MPLTPEEQTELDQLNSIQAGKPPTSNLTSEEQAELDQLNTMHARQQAGQSTWGDIKHGAIPWAAQSGAGLLGIPGAINSGINKGIGKVAGWVGADSMKADAEKAQKDIDPYTPGGLLNKADTAFPGHDLTYQPQSFGGKVAQNFEAIAPQVAAGGGRGLVSGAGSALGSAAAGEAVDRWAPDWLQPYAKPLAEIAGGTAGWSRAGAGLNKFTPKPISAERAAAVKQLERQEAPVTAAQKSGSSNFSWLEKPPGQTPDAPDLTNQIFGHIGANPRAGQTALQATNDRVNQLKFQLNQNKPAAGQAPSVAYKRIAEQLGDAQAVQNTAMRTGGTTLPYQDVHSSIRSPKSPLLRDVTGPATSVYGSTPASKAPVPGGADALGSLAGLIFGTSGPTGTVSRGMEGSVAGHLSVPGMAQQFGRFVGRPLANSGLGQAVLKRSIPMGQSAWLPPAQRSRYLDPKLTAALLGLQKASNQDNPGAQ